ncbi:hypothetical protein ABO04_00825 [Nitrosomonas sp. HPC101]|uniref:hypothetical protein n=1 Tax=Nitrosomonas sp. HPC101 TaxID=1658667 RepID=UPI001369CBF4|nr:hypothetical protein [Nitrosomonas sp. HPC101]MXS84490.1 hypothetical protein [Nitrosomonas sp. HPC101]
MVDKNWTFEEAWAAQEAAFESDPSSIDDPASPYRQWQALHQLDIFEEAYKKDPFYLMQAIGVCALHGLPLPPWAVNAYLKGYNKIADAESKSWDEVFGMPYPKGVRLSVLRKERRFKHAVYDEISRIKKSQPKVAIDDDLFEKVGKKFGLGKTLTSEYYYAVKPWREIFKEAFQKTEYID